MEPRKLTPAVQERIVQAIRAGASAEVAAESAGIARSTFFAWLERGRAGERRFTAFAAEVKLARAAAEVHAVAVVRQAMNDGDWRAALAWLERRHPVEWGRQSKAQAEQAEPEKPAWKPPTFDGAAQEMKDSDHDDETKALTYELAARELRGETITWEKQEAWTNSFLRSVCDREERLTERLQEKVEAS